MFESCISCITAAQKLQFTLKNVSSCPSHLSNGGKLYIYIRYVSLTITHAYLLCAWIMTLITVRAVPNVYFI